MGLREWSQGGEQKDILKTGLAFDEYGVPGLSRCCTRLKESTDPGPPSSPPSNYVRQPGLEDGLNGLEVVRNDRSGLAKEADAGGAGWHWNWKDGIEAARKGGRQPPHWGGRCIARAGRGSQTFQWDPRLHHRSRTVGLPRKRQMNLQVLVMHLTQNPIAGLQDYVVINCTVPVYTLTECEIFTGEVTHNVER